MRARVLVLSMCLLLGGCPKDAPLFDEPFTLLGPYAVGGRIALVDRTRGEVHLITPALEGPVVHDIIEIGHRPETATVDLSGERLLVITHGTPGGPGIREEEEALYAVFPDGRTERYEVGSPFTAIGLHPDGERLFLYFDQTVMRRPELVYNAHEVALLDLAEPPSEANPSLRTVRSFGGVPTRALFSPPLQVAGETLSFVAVLATNWVTLIDLDHPERSEISIPLTLDRASDTVDPREIVFSQPDPDTDPVVYVSASGSFDVFAYTLRESDRVSEGGHHFNVATNLYAVGSTPTDLQPVTLASGDSLLVASGSTTVWLIDTSTSEAVPIALEERAERIVPVPGAGGTPSELILYGQSTNVIHFAGLAGLEDSVERDVSAVALPSPVERIEPLPDGESAAVFHADANHSLSILRLRDRSVAVLTATAPLERTVFSSDGSLAFVAPRSGAKLSVIRLVDRHPEDLRLDDTPTGITLVPGPEVLVVTHESDVGLMTLLDAAAPSRETARVLEGFLLEGFLDRNGEMR